MAARSIDATIANQTPHRLIRTDSQAVHGGFTTEAPAAVDPNAQGQFSMESNGFATGCEGYATYRMDGVAGTLRLHFNNPYIGGNDYSATSTPAGYSCSRTGGEGHNAVVTFTVVPA
jgi:hypothetical protein